jgi:GT2 family glycosyltransferase/glycosyltransferase involved in cell wall biosynthesis
MCDFYQSLDMYVCASRSEGTPNPCLEAAACGVPIITTRVGNMPELIQDGVNGLFVDRDVRDIAAKITLLRDNPELREKLSQAMLTAIRAWDWKIQAKNFRQMFTTVLDNQDHRVNNSVTSAAPIFAVGAIPSTSSDLQKHGDAARVATPVCIAGMHRSGTSLVARLLYLCGLYLGPQNDLSSSDQHNQAGYWENIHFVMINDALLAALNGGWDVPPALLPGWERKPELGALRKRALDLIHQFKDSRNWGWKDPRNSITLSFWKSLIPDLKVVICLRNPLEVAQSLFKRGQSSDAFGWNLWYTHNQRLMAETSAENRIITHYDSYFFDPRSELRRVLELLEMPVSDATIERACAGVTFSLRHNRATFQDLAHAKIPAHIFNLYLEMCAEAGAVYQTALGMEPVQSVKTNSARDDSQVARLSAEHAEPSSVNVPSTRYETANVLQSSPEISIIVLNHNGQEHLEHCLPSLFDLDFPKSQREIIVVDNGSFDGSIDLIQRKFRGVRVVRSEKNLGFSQGCNLGASSAAGEYLAFLNNDMRVDRNWLGELLRLIQSQERIACAGSIIRDWEGTAIEFPARRGDPFSLGFIPLPDATGLPPGDYHLFVSGGAMLIRADAFRKAGGFDPDYFMYHEDVDLGWRLWLAGFKCIIARESVVYHRGGASSGNLAREFVDGLSQEHALCTLYKNLENDNLKTLLPLVFYFLLVRGRWWSAGHRALPRALEGFRDALAALAAKRRRIQSARVMSDADLFALVGHPLDFLLNHESYKFVREGFAGQDSAIAFDPRKPSTVSRAVDAWLNSAHLVFETNLLKELDEKERGLQSVSHHAAAKQKAVEELQAQAAAKDQAAQALMDQIAEKEQTVQMLTAQAAEQRQTFERQIAEKEQTAQMLTAQAAEQQQIFEKQIADKERQLQSRAAELAKKEHSLRTLTRLVGEKEQTAQALGAQVAEKEQQIQTLSLHLNTILGSKLWKVATVYRALLKRVWSLGSIFRRAKPGVIVAAPAALPAAQTVAPRAPSSDIPGSSKFDIICFPIIDWDFRFQRPQQLMTQFAQNAHRVFYLNTHFTGLDKTAAAVRALAERVWELALPGETSAVIYRDSLAGVSLDKSSAALCDFIRAQNISEAILFVQHPFWTPLAREIKARYGWKIIYDCMDDHSGFQVTNRNIAAMEAELVPCCDLVVTTAQLLYRRFSKLHSNCILVPNAGDYDHFSQLPPRDTSPIAHLPRPIIGYYGAIAEWFDVEAIREAATRHPEWSFALIGHTFGANLQSLQGLPNVHLLGEKPYAELPAFLSAFDVCAIPFRRTPLTEATNPVKVFEYLAAGKPVVAAALPELEPLADVIHRYTTADQFIARVEQAVVEISADLSAKRQAVARKNTWEMRFQSFEASIGALFGKAAIIVVTWNNLDLTRQCLESLLVDETYPNFRIIIIDNASTDGTIEYLEALSAREPRVQTIFNARNLGFSAANNLGIQRAQDCEFIVLLNNDTVVPRGWLARLIRHARKPDIGMVGPVTNWVGNEAKIDVPYTALEDMEAFAAAYVNAHEGMVFDIKMLALFCAAMRKAVVDQVGLLDERFEAGMFEDDDYARRVRQAGYRVVCAEDVFVHHHGKSSFSRLENAEYLGVFELNKRLYEDKWGEPWEPHQGRKQ